MTVSELRKLEKACREFFKGLPRDVLALAVNRTELLEETVNVIVEHARKRALHVAHERV